MKNKRGNVVVIVIIIVIVAITASVVTWLVATKTQAPIQQVAVTQPTTLKEMQSDTQIDNRILLTPQNTSQYFTSSTTACDEAFNDDTANSQIAYNNDEKGIQFEIPFNQNWGSKKFKLNPFDLNNNNLSFGSMSIFEGCSTIRSYSLDFKPAMPAEKVVIEIEKGITPITTKINDLTVIKYVQADMCTNSFMEVIGKKFNYLFSTSCGVDAVKDSQNLENIIKSVKLK